MKPLSHVVLFAATASAAWTEKPVQDQPFFPPNGANYPIIAPSQNSTYEYIVVGSGPGGGPLAARLALAGHSVLLVDAGADHGNDRQVQVPALHPYASEYNPIKWDFFVDHYADDDQARKDSKLTYQTPEGDYWTRLDMSEDQPPAGSKKKGVLYPRTGALGGCSVHNALISILPTGKDWDDVAALTGDSSWKASNMLQYFKKLEKNAYLQGVLQGAGHGFDGWLPTRLTPAILIAQDTKVLSLILAAATATGKGLLSGILGLATNLATVLTLDINTPSPTRDTVEKLYQIPLAMDENFIRRGPRDFVIDVASATNKDGSKKYKLDIALNTLVTKVTFDTSGTKPKATGVDYLHGASLYAADARPATGAGIAGSVTASKEVIVSGGAFNTPQILKLSGIGPAAELAAFDIPLIKDLPGVGGNLQDRYEVGVVGKTPNDFSLLANCTFLGAFDGKGESDPCYNDYTTLPGDLKGAYTTNGIAFGLMRRSSVAGHDPDLFLGGVPAYFNGYFPGYSKHATQELNTWTWLTLKARSRNNAGSVNLTSANPRDTPKITFNSFAGPDGEKDLTAMVEGMQYGMSAFEKIGAGLLGLDLPTLGVPLLEKFEVVWPPANVSTPEQLREFARNEAWGHHASCTAPIGKDDDPMAVLDSNFRVRGVEGLRVVDASVFPTIPGTYIALPIYMVSEKAADVILKGA